MNSVFRNAEAKKTCQGCLYGALQTECIFSLSSNWGRKRGSFHLRTFQRDRILKLSEYIGQFNFFYVQVVQTCTLGEQIHLNNELEGYILCRCNQVFFGGRHKIVTIISQPAKGNDNRQTY